MGEGQLSEEYKRGKQIENAEGHPGVHDGSLSEA